ncbi:MAG: hypothetical protein A6F72_03390 [Cycloclasticus sp. symbiont of Poecilosclerida sp. N]|nr:MAG: hypothetical protein A6F72_03390 [Cycloclasticus sp. symbiont of Poecilosclerida sp. N]
MPSTSLQQTLGYLDKALKQSFSKKSATKGFPKFKRKRHYHGSFSLVMINNKAISEYGKKVKIPKS